MRCPYCNYEDTQVKDSRPSEDGTAIRRRRFCPNCDSRFTTFERVQLRELMVIKKNGEKHPFDRDKLARSIMISLRKRPVTEETIEAMVSTIVRELEGGGESEVPVEQIGQMVMNALAEVDKVAFIRFASVYKDFNVAKDFEDFVAKIKK